MTGMHKVSSQTGSSLGKSKHLAVVTDTAICGGVHDLSAGCPEVAWAHDAGFSNAKTQDEVVPPQACIVVSTTCCDSFGIYRVTVTKTHKIQYSARLAFQRHKNHP